MSWPCCFVIVLLAPSKHETYPTNAGLLLVDCLRRHKQSLHWCIAFAGLLTRYDNTYYTYQWQTKQPHLANRYGRSCCPEQPILQPHKYVWKWNESGFRPPLCTYRLNWARRTSWGWWDDWYDTVLQTQDSKFEPWRSEAEHATSQSRRLPTILTFTRGWGRNIFVSFKPPRPGTEPRTLAWKAAVLTTTLGPPPK